MNTPTRKIEETYHCEAKTEGGKLRLTFYGNSSTGTQVTFKIGIPWWHWAYIVREVGKAWLTERKSRQSEIDRINSAFPNQLPE